MNRDRFMICEPIKFIKIPKYQNSKYSLDSTVSGDGKQIEWNKLGQRIEPNSVTLDTAFTFLADSNPKNNGKGDESTLFCVALQCGLNSNSSKSNQSNDDNKSNVTTEPPSKKRKISNTAQSTDSNSQSSSMVKVLKFYEMDLNGNRIGAIYTVPVAPTAHNIISVPFTLKHRLFGGVIVCSANTVWYIYPQRDSTGISKCHQIRCFIPRRTLEVHSNDGTKPNGDSMDLKASDIVITAHCTYHNGSDLLYFLLQSDRGDITKFSLCSNTQNSGNNQFEAMTLQYLDSVPVSHCISILGQSEYIFFGTESANNYFCKIKSLGQDDKTPIISASVDTKPPLFMPQTNVHFRFLSEYQSISNILGIRADDLLNEIQPQIYCLCGWGQHSSLQMIRNGRCLSRIGKQKLTPRPFQLSRIWTISTVMSEENTNLMVVSTKNGGGSSQRLTMMFRVSSKGDVEDIPSDQSPFDHTADTLHFGTLALGQNTNSNLNMNINPMAKAFGLSSNMALIQITSSGITLVANHCDIYHRKESQNVTITHCDSTPRAIIMVCCYVESLCTFYSECHDRNV